MCVRASTAFIVTWSGQQGHPIVLLSKSGMHEAAYHPLSRLHDSDERPIIVPHEVKPQRPSSSSPAVYRSLFSMLLCTPDQTSPSFSSSIVSIFAASFTLILVLIPFSRSLFLSLFVNQVIERKGLHVVADLPQGGSCLADKETLRLALKNVLDNATKFCPDGGDISVHMAWRPDATGIRIGNTSDELSREDLSRIFDPFYRSQRSAASGSGLGLTIARKAVERLGGTIEAADREIGLEITITLPRQ